MLASVLVTTACGEKIAGLDARCSKASESSTEQIAQSALVDFLTEIAAGKHGKDLSDSYIRVPSRAFVGLQSADIDSRGRQDVELESGDESRFFGFRVRQAPGLNFIVQVYPRCATTVRWHRIR